MRALGNIVATTLVLGAMLAGCGAAPGTEAPTTPTADLAPLEISQPSTRLRGIEGQNAVIELSVVVSNPNQVPLTMRRVDGQVLLNGEQAARIEVEGEEIVEASSQRPFVLEVVVPLGFVMQLEAQQYVARGELYADAGSGDGALRSPFEFTQPIPR